MDKTTKAMLAALSDPAVPLPLLPEHASTVIAAAAQIYGEKQVSNIQALEIKLIVRILGTATSAGKDPGIDAIESLSVLAQRQASPAVFSLFTSPANLPSLQPPTCDLLRMDL